ncbi:somatostatin-1-like [Cottoperca gobio]|uniref:Somatostatin-1-like n=1 Tax=Cottoperca gobio TaxID=56716 RepID=A0A6J2RG61_COTGO|nr:somatostatin-1-like [Cottoperca gobio]
MCVAENTETQQGFKDLQLQLDLSPWLDKIEDKQELTKKENLMDLLYKLSKFENGNILKGATDSEKQEKNRRGLAMTTRRMGCRIFYWKSWTSC